MPLKVRLETVVYGIFYLALIAVLVLPLQKLINIPTAFEEFQIGNEAELPSIIICPFSNLNDTEDEIKNFNHTHIAIEKAKKEYFGNAVWSKSYHKE